MLMPTSAAIAWITSATACVSAPFGTMKSTANGVGDARFLQQRLGLGDVARRDRKLLLVIRILRADPLVARHELAVEHHLR